MMPIVSDMAEDKEVTNTLINTGSPFALANADSESHPIIMSVDGDKLIVTSDGSPVSTGLGNVLPSTFSDYKTGPFNTYYVAINLASGDNSDDAGETRLSKEKGEVAYLLNANNLHQTAKGYTFNPTLYNVMLVIPPVYWYSEMDAPTTENPNPTTGKLYMASSPDAFVSLGITADKLKDYAHTYTSGGVVGHAPAIAIGVYEGYNDNGVLTSQSGVSPSGHTSIVSLTQWAESGNTDVTMGSYTLWNFYMWELYKLMGWTVMGNADSQYMMGNGVVGWNSVGLTSPAITGVTDSAYTQSYDAGTPICLFLENTWGSVSEILGNTYWNYVSGGTSTLVAGNSIDNPTASGDVQNTLSNVYIPPTKLTSAGNYVYEIDTNSETFGMAISVRTANTSINDGQSPTVQHANQLLVVGGYWQDANIAYQGIDAQNNITYSWNSDYGAGNAIGSRLAYVVTDSSFSIPHGADDDFAYIMSYTKYGEIQNVQSIENNVATSYMPNDKVLNSYWDFVPYAELPQLSDATNSVDLAVGSDSILQFYNSGNVVLQTATGTVDLGRVNDVTPTPVTVTVQNGVMTYTKADSTTGTANVLLYKANEGDYVYGQNVKLLNDLSQGNVYVGQYQYGVATANGTKDIGAIGTFTSQTETVGEGEDATEVTTVVPDVALFNTANVSTSTVTSSITQGQYYATINSISIATEFSDSDSVDYTVTGFYAPKTQTYVTIENGGGLAYDILLYLPILILISVITFIGYATLRPDSDFIRSLKSR